MARRKIAPTEQLIDDYLVPEFECIYNAALHVWKYGFYNAVLMRAFVGVFLYLRNLILWEKPPWLGFGGKSIGSSKRQQSARVNGLLYIFKYKD